MPADKELGSAAGAAPFDKGQAAPAIAVAAAPWSVDFGEAYRIKDARGNTVATMNIVHLNGRRSAREVAANARLIASAPDLLEALKVAQKLAASGPAPLPPSDPRWAQIADALSRAESN